MTAPGPEEQGLQFPGFTGGLNKQAHPSRLEPNELAEALNVVLGSRGEARLRHGLDDFSVFTDAVNYRQIMAWNTDQVASGVGTQPFFAIKNTDDLTLNYQNAGRQELVLDSTGPDGIDTRFGFVVMNGLAYVSSFDGAFEVNPATPTSTPLTAWDPDAGNTTTNFPNTNRLLVAYERVFAARLDDGPTEANKYRLYFSEPLLPKTWDTTNYVDINPDDGQPIQSLWLFADQIIIFKDRSVWGLAGTEFEGLNIKLYQIEGAIGTTAPETIVDIGSLLCFFDPTSGIYLFDGSAFQDIGEPIFDYMQANWDEANLSRSVAWYRDGRYFLSVPWSGGDGLPQRTFIFDVALKAWVEWDRGFQGATLLTEDDGTETVVVCRHGTEGAFTGVDSLSLNNKDDNGIAIDFEVRTGWLAPTGSATRHRIRQAIFDLIDTTINTVVSVFTNFDTTAAHASVTLDSSAGEEEGISMRSHAFNGFRWRTISVKVAGTAPATNTVDWRLNSMRLVTTSHGRFRGE